MQKKGLFQRLRDLFFGEGNEEDFEKVLGYHAEGVDVEKNELDTSAFKRMVERVVKELNRIAAEADSIMKVIENAAITGNIAAKNAEIAAIVTNAKRTTDSVAVATAQLGPVLSDAKASVASLQQTLSVLQTDQSSVGKILYRPDLYTRIDSIATSVDQLLDDMKLHPKRYFDVDVYLIERKKKAE